MNFHTPVLLGEVLELLDPKPGQTVIDGTLGGGGHAAALIERIEPNGTFLGIDLDPAAIEQAKQIFAEKKFKSQINLVRGNYKDIDLFAAAADKILIDVGISSYDLENSHRGFSFQKDEPLDMRFDPQSAPENKHQEPFTAHYILNNYPEKDLEKIFWEFGEEKFGKRIARTIVESRQSQELLSTTELFELIKKALPAQFRFRAAESARRIFQSLRIEVNKELDNISEFLPKAFKLLNPGGRMAVISFHSLEDRIVKQFFNDKAKGCICPPEFPVCNCGRNAEAKILTKKPVTASAEEIEQNPRSKPAKLRLIQKNG